MFALGIGGMDAAVVMAGFPFELSYPRIVRVVLENQLEGWVSAKDVILEMLRRPRQGGMRSCSTVRASRRWTSASEPRSAT